MKNFLAKKYWHFELPPLSRTNEMVLRYEDVIDLSIGDPDLAVDERIVAYQDEQARLGHTKYTEFLGDRELRSAVCDWYNKEYGSSYAEENVMICSGGTHAMFILMESILDEGDEVILISPYYTYYEPQITIPGGRVVLYSTSAQDHFEIDVEALEKQVTERTKALIVNTPNNPTGRVYKEETLRALVDLAKRKDFLLISDDIYGALNYTERPVSLVEVAPDSEHVVSVYSFSKDYCMTGFRIGFVVGSQRIVECLRNVNEAVNFTVNSMAQRAAIYALQNRDELCAPVREEYHGRALYMYERLKEMNNVRVIEPEGTFYLFADISQTGLSAMEIWEKILDEAHVLVLPGTGFGEAGEGFIRIACTKPIEVLEEACNRLEKCKFFE